MAAERDTLTALDRALERRQVLLDGEDVTAYRLLSGPFEGVPGVFVDRYGPAAALAVYEPQQAPVEAIAAHLQERLGLRAVYLKRFVKDRSALGGRFDEQLRDPAPLLGEAVPETLTIMEYGASFEARLYDGYSTGLFLEQRENRRFLAREVAGQRVLNTFAYTCGFSVTCARAGATVTSVDVSKRYLDWGKRNFELNGLAAAEHYFTAADALEFLRFAKKRELRFDLVILDPPSFGAGKKGKSFSATRDYAELLQRAAAVLGPRGRLFASTNNTTLARGETLDQLIREALGRGWRRLELPDAPLDFAMETGRLACRLLRRQ
ncbi:MAG: class I SAM-dependent rRNA methyltransferase [Phycisphaerales bacterium JB038]